MSDLAFCEPNPATTFSRMHIRIVGPEGRLYGGGINGSALCGLDRLGWDIEGPVTLDRLDAQSTGGTVGLTCAACASEAKTLLESVAPERGREGKTK